MDKCLHKHNDLTGGGGGGGGHSLNSNLPAPRQSMIISQHKISHSKGSFVKSTGFSSLKMFRNIFQSYD